MKKHFLYFEDLSQLYKLKHGKQNLAVWVSVVYNNPIKHTLQKKISFKNLQLHEKISYTFFKKLIFSKGKLF